MVVMILERVPESVRGELSLWMIEPKAGVFVGNLSALVRDKLWDKVREKSKRGSCTMIHTHNNEQGYLISQHGESSRTIEDIEGIQLIKFS
ncbi:MAG TPA: type I-E CRISPR-associated endoribonuclease Cas2e [Thermotogota bacterium]|mgnify:CR=1 FL=1|nr:type I-E CRISPR-associated endoribonuclease Cas2 [Thermotogota bacterium]NLH18548.1 type I-E CRISPR-associated endoribonuclease Cas2 [Thermotogaceae bacterium]OQC31926.1 MAG: CRISPR-associated endoribonuclease Cas2 [Thermotogota bacterium ADurb.Bin062]HNW46596.1 type I-E CRISPR-associated endoribonuclease Cas2e [Thermotogota bacterium]HOD91588.1 type I-E CRISPR-associated endoribonuclease Cas2e [Thermotogota bacterium]